MSHLRLALTDTFRDAVRELLPPDQERKQAAIRESYDAGGSLKNDALARSLPPYLVSWWLPGGMTTGVNKEREIELPTESRITGIRLRAKTAPAAAELTVALKGNGAVIETASISIGQSSGRTVGINALVDAGTVLTIDVTSAGGSDVTVVATYVPLST